MSVDNHPATTPSTVLDRACLILEAFDGAGPLTLAEVARRTGIPNSSAHRILEQLLQLKWLRREGRDYELGTRLMELGSSAIHQDRFHRAAEPYLNDLHRATGLVVHLALLDGADVVYLEKIGGTLAASVPTRVGGRQPAHCTGVGKAILAFTGSGVHPAALIRRTRYSITDPRQLNKELDKVRAHGVAYEREESLPGIACVAAPIGEPGDAAAAVSVCGPVRSMDLDRRLAGPVRMTALAIWRNLNDASARVSPTLQQRSGLRFGPDTTTMGPRRELSAVTG